MSASFEATCDQCGVAIDDVTENESSQPAELQARQSHFQPPTTLRLAGMWMLSVPNVVAGCWFPFWVFKHLSGLVAVMAFWGDIALTSVWFIIFYSVTRNYFFRRSIG